MTMETWIAFCAASVLVALLPSPLTTLIARYADQAGRRTAAVTIPGAALGLGAALTIAALPLAAITWAAPALLDPLAWAALAYLMLYALWSLQEPSLRTPLAANDNLPEHQPVRIFARMLVMGLGRLRYIVLMAALLVQFIEPTMLNGASPIIEIQLVFMVLLALGSLVHVVFPQRSYARARRSARMRPASHKMGTLFIARRAVSAGYRRIAA
ncbi:MAG TPA: LysE family transporter [Pseudorhizobium sp.]|nr:LysE family transporter [Pseudorhizobium sp.]